MKHLPPRDAWNWLQQHPETLFVDVRMELEYLYVGHPPSVVHVSWYEYPELTPRPQRFVEEVIREAGRLDRPVMLICRSGRRSLEAGKALEEAGFQTVISVLHGFEGDLDVRFHRSSVNGWRHDGLPWEQL